MVKKLTIISLVIAGLAAGIFILAKYYPPKSESIEIKSESPKISVETENNISVESPEIKNVENADMPKEIAEEKEKPMPQSVSEDKAPDKSTSIASKLVSWGYEKSDSRKIDTIIIHSSYNALGGDEYDLDKLIKEYKEYGVAPHYLIDRKGKIYRLVADKNIAYHAGESEVPDGRKSVNNFSIGIELMNTKDDKCTSDQYSALKKIVADLKNSYKIKYVLGHNQIAPGRKTDPWNFDWGKM